MFHSIQELVQKAQEQDLSIGQMMLQYEAASQEVPEQAVLDKMLEQWQVMKRAAHKGLEGLKSHSGMTGGDAKRLHDYLQKGDVLTDSTFLSALTYAVATNETNASMGVICATPTAGACGVLPGVLMALQEKMNLSDMDIIYGLLCAGAIGFVIANNASISGAAGGCQAEIGSASSMAAAAAVELKGGSPHQAAHAMAMALKNMLGLSCDPLAGLVEVPCIKRNAAGASNALAAAEMALAGVESYVPWDEVIEAMHRIGLFMPASLRETALGGLADTPTGRKWKKLLWQSTDQTLWQSTEQHPC